MRSLIRMAGKFNPGRAGIWVEPKSEMLHDDRTEIDFIAEVDVAIIWRLALHPQRGLAVNEPSPGTRIRSISSRTSCSTGSSVTTSGLHDTGAQRTVHGKRVSARRANIELGGEAHNVHDPERRRNALALLVVRRHGKCFPPGGMRAI